MDLPGPWEWLEGSLPVELTQLRAQHPRGHVRRYLSGTPEYRRRLNVKKGQPPVVDFPQGDIPEIIIEKEPAELVLLEGDPLFMLVSWGVKLMTVANTDSDMIFHPQQFKYFLLIAGRWFVADDALGPWKTFRGTLPKEFQQIPRDHRLAHVLSSVPGTPEAAEAIARAQLREEVVVKRRVLLDVRYADKKINRVPLGEGAEIVKNSEDWVFKVGSSYFACGRGVWFRSSDGHSSSGA